MKHVTLTAAVLGLALASSTSNYAAEKPVTQTPPDSTPVQPEIPAQPETPPVEPPVTTPTPPEILPPVTPPPTPEAPVAQDRPTPPVTTPPILETPVRPERPALPELPAIGGGPDVSAAVRDALARAREQRVQYLAVRIEAAKEMKGATAEARAELRAKLKVSREEFLAAQRESRATYRQNLQNLRQRLADHAEVVEQIKEDAKAQGKARRGGVEE